MGGCLSTIVHFKNIMYDDVIFLDIMKIIVLLVYYEHEDGSAKHVKLSASLVQG